MIKSIKEIRDELNYISSPELIDSILKEWADSIVDECCNNAKLELLPNHMGDINGDCYCIGHESILQVKEQIK